MVLPGKVFCFFVPVLPGHPFADAAVAGLPGDDDGIYPVLYPVGTALTRPDRLWGAQLHRFHIFYLHYGSKDSCDGGCIVYLVNKPDTTCYLRLRIRFKTQIL